MNYIYYKTQNTLLKLFSFYIFNENQFCRFCQTIPDKFTIFGRGISWSVLRECLCCCSLKWRIKYDQEDCCLHTASVVVRAEGCPAWNCWRRLDTHIVTVTPVQGKRILSLVHAAFCALVSKSHKPDLPQPFVGFSVQLWLA